MPKESVADKRRREFAEECAIALGLSASQDDAVPFAQYARSPVEFVREVLEVPTLTTEQIQILESVRDKAETNVQAAHGVGKSFISACIVIYWCFAVGGLAISTAPTEAQVKQILWSEVRKLYDKNKSKLGGERGELFLKFSESARAYGFTSKNYDSNSFQGKHAEKLLLIQDEACGITEEIDDGFISCLTGSENRGLRIGNPIVGGTPFEKACARQHIRISAWSHINVAWAYEQCNDGIHRLKPDVVAAIIDPVTGDVLPQSVWPDWCGRDRIPGAISIAWIEKARKKGETSAFWQSRVEGLFPVDSEQSIVPRSWFLQARARYDADPQKWDFMAEHHHWRHGLDVGDGGDDHARASWRGPVLYGAITQSTKGDRLDVSRAALLGAKTLDDMPGSISVDIIGVGSGSLSQLLEDDYPASGTHWGGAAVDNALFANLKAEQYWLLREGFRSEEIAIAPLGEIEEMLMEDLAGTYYEETTTGKTKIEDKKKTTARLHRSPNVGDATVLGFNGAGGVVEFESVGKRSRVGSRLRDY
ncbi:MAG: hypothetical protein KME52_18500 [Desmonostoc geniculatum HA4340-LM1]|jgi:hypothetical protein|nr:hypothetical protein [Desmonostoc geniculatum HA4340-LM1]